ncbi:MAG TPA: DinB family protein [Planctomycetota bacterium]|nr:DinB family protein [Planctomycetota bacterium]
MNINEFAVGALENAYRLVTMSVDGLTDVEMMFQPKPGLNHAKWLLGHAIDSENGLILSLCKGENLLPKGWHEKYGIGSKPSANADDYPSKTEMLALLAKVHAAAVAYVKGLSAEAFDARPQGLDRMPERARELFATVGKCVWGHVTHAAGHAAQIAMIRRLLGKPPRV